MDLEFVQKKHHEIFGEKSELVVHAPGRVNLIGEHTDYSDGFVMPIALKRGITLSISKAPDNEIMAVYSIDYESKMVSSYSNLMKSNTEWYNYPLGVVKILRDENYKFGGIRITFTGDIPQGAGLSSSAALEVAVAYAINGLYGLKIDKQTLAKICQRAEHEIVGVKCGIMDQYISLLGKKDHALLIDCRSLEFREVPIELNKVAIVITNSNVPHKLSSSLYNQRVMECEEAIKILKMAHPGTHLRDYSLKDYEENKELMPDNIQKRAYHVITENNRVLEAEKALKNRDLEKFGQLMNESHQSLKDFYEVTSPELDWLAESAQSISGCYGSCMTGAGFGGCTVSLIQNKRIKQYKELLKKYEKKFGYTPVMYITTPHGGVEIL